MKKKTTVLHTNVGDLSELVLSQHHSPLPLTAVDTQSQGDSIVEHSQVSETSSVKDSEHIPENHSMTRKGNFFWLKCHIFSIFFCHCFDVCWHKMSQLGVANVQLCLFFCKNKNKTGEEKNQVQ